MRLCIIGKDATKVSEHIRGSMMSVCITGDVNLDHLVKVVFIRIFSCKSNYVPFEMTKYLGERYFESL